MASWLLYVDPLLALGACVFLVGWVHATLSSRRRLVALETSASRFRHEAAEKQHLLEAASERGQEAERAVTELEQTIRELPEIAQRLMETQEIREIPRRALELIQEVFQPRYSAFFRLGRGEFVAVAVHGIHTRFRVGQRIKAGESIVGWTAMKQLVYTPEDVRLETPLARAQHIDKGPQEDFQLCLPIAQGDSTLGVILVGPSTRNLGHSREIGRTIALLTSATITAARLLRDQSTLAKRDGLTGLFNKANIRSQLDYLLEGPDAAPSYVSTFLFDIDHFKHYNDSNGHLAGDELLKALGALLRQAIREGEFVGRYGGEEFLMILPGANKDEALRAAERIRSVIARQDFPFGAGQPMGRVTVSGGVASFPMDANDAESLLKRADEALYEAKRAGRDRILPYTSQELLLDESVLAESVKLDADPDGSGEQE